MVIFCAVPELNIYGLALGNIVLSATVCLLALIKMKQSVSLSYFDLLVPLVSSFIMLSVVLKFVEELKFSGVLTLASGVFIGIAIYGFLCFPCIFATFKEFVKKRKKKEV